MKTLKIIKNRYFYSTAILIFSLLLIDDTTMYKLFKMKIELSNLIDENQKKIEEISLIKDKTKQLTSSKVALEILLENTT